MDRERDNRLIDGWDIEMDGVMRARRIYMERQPVGASEKRDVGDGGGRGLCGASIGV